MKIQAQQLEELMQKPAPEAMNQLTSWLQALGLKLTIKIAPKMPEINHENDAVGSIKITV
jgi:chromatin remodeling complex protein RSC6